MNTKIELEHAIKFLIDDHFSAVRVGPEANCTEAGTPFVTYGWGVELEEDKACEHLAWSPMSILLEVVRWLKAQDKAKTVVWRRLPRYSEYDGVLKVTWRLAVE